MKKEASGSVLELGVTTLSLTLTLAMAGLGVWILAGPDSLPDYTVHMYRCLGRSARFVAYWLLFLSVALGIAVSSRVFDGVLNRPWVYEAHKFISIFVLLAMASQPVTKHAHAPHDHDREPAGISLN